MNKLNDTEDQKEKYLLLAEVIQEQWLHGFDINFLTLQTEHSQAQLWLMQFMISGNSIIKCGS